MITTQRLTEAELEQKTTTASLANTPGTIDFDALCEIVETKKYGYIEIQKALPGELNFAGYGRNSKGEATKVMDQVMSIRAWEKELTAKYGVTCRITHFYWDRTSAWTRPEQEPPYRPGWEILNVHAYEQRRYDGVACWVSSRLSRDRVQPIDFVNRMGRRNVIVWTEVEGVQHMNDLGGSFMTAAKAFTNEDYSATTSKNIRSKRRPKNQLGFYVGGSFPLGYTLKGIVYAEDGTFTAPLFERVGEDGTRANGKIMEPAQGWEATVRKIYKHIVENGGSLRDAADMLVADGWLEKNADQRKTNDRARYALTNPILAGYLTHNDSAKESAADMRNRNNRYRDFTIRIDRVQKDADGKPVQGVEAVLSLDEYLSLQMAINKRTFTRAPLVDVLLRKMVKCGKCGRTCSRRTSSSAVSGVYSCNGLQDKSCKGVSIQVAMLEKYAVECLKAKFDEENARAEHGQYESQLANLSDGNDEMNQIAKLRTLLDETIDAINPDLSPVLLEAYQKKAEKIAEQIEELQKLAPKLPSAQPVAKVLPAGGLEQWDQLDFETQRKVISAAIEGVLVLPVGKGKARVMNDPAKLKALLDERVVIWWRGERQPAAWNLIAE
jgi:DNA invertase Pin-like site-specific DNA recombinase